MAVKCPFPVSGLGAGDVGTDFRDDGRAEGDVGDEMAVHDVDVEPGFAVSIGIATALLGGMGFSAAGGIEWGNEKGIALEYVAKDRFGAPWLEREESGTSRRHG